MKHFTALLLPDDLGSSLHFVLSHATVKSLRWCPFLTVCLQHLTVCLSAAEDESIYGDDKKVEDACLKGLNIISS